MEEIIELTKFSSDILSSIVELLGINIEESESETIPDIFYYILLLEGTKIHKDLLETTIMKTYTQISEVRIEYRTNN